MRLAAHHFVLVSKAGRLVLSGTLEEVKRLVEQARAHKPSLSSSLPDAVAEVLDEDALANLGIVAAAQLLQGRVRDIAASDDMINLKGFGRPLLSSAQQLWPLLTNAWLHVKRMGWPRVTIFLAYPLPGAHRAPSNAHPYLYLPHLYLPAPNDQGVLVEFKLQDVGLHQKKHTEQPHHQGRPGTEG